MPANHLQMLYRQKKIDYYVLESSVYVNTGKGGYTYFNDDSYLDVNVNVGGHYEWSLVKRRLITKRIFRKVLSGEMSCEKMFKLTGITSNELEKIIVPAKREFILNSFMQKGGLKGISFINDKITFHLYR